MQMDTHIPGVLLDTDDGDIGDIHSDEADGPVIGLQTPFVQTPFVSTIHQFSF